MAQTTQNYNKTILRVKKKYLKKVKKKIKKNLKKNF